MLSKAFISVIIPVFNNETFVEEAIASAHKQPEVFEVLVIDDGSTDNTYRLLNTLTLKYTKLKLFQHPFRRNKGIAASRNLGIQKSVCDWIAFLDSDDIYLEGRFESAKKIIENNPHIDGVYSFSQHFENSTNKLTAIGGVEGKHHPDELFSILVKGDHAGFDTPSILVKKSLLIKVNLFEHRIKNCDDTQMWYKLSLVGILVPDETDLPLSYIRRHENNIWNGKDHKYIYFHGHFLMFLFMTDFILKHGNSNQKLAFFRQFAEDYKNFYKMLPNHFKRKWFRDIFLRLITYLLINRNEDVTYKQFKKNILNWLWNIIKKDYRPLLSFHEL